MSQGIPIKLMDGVSVGDRYVVLRVLGEGGMGQVALVRQKLTNKLGAMKLLTTMAPELVERFNREAAAPSRLNHPAFPTVFDFGEYHGSPYIVMDYVDGETITGIARRGHRFSLAEIVELGRQACEAMSVAHEAGLVHRDLKSDNLMLVARPGALPHLYVLDLGIAKFSLDGPADMRTRTGMLIGTPMTMSPEQAQGHVVDARSDIYSLGCVLFFMATGRYPFEAEDPLQLAMQHVLAEAPHASRFAEWLPTKFAQLLGRTMQKDPAARFASMRELDAALAEFAASDVGPADYVGPLVTGAASDASAGRGATPHDLRRTSGVAARTPRPSQSRTVGSLSGANGEVSKATPGGRLGVWLGGAGAAISVVVGVVLSWPRATSTPVTAPPIVTPQVVRLTYETTPSDATLTIDGRPAAEHFVVGTPGSRHTVVIAATGYETQSFETTLRDRDETRHFVLAKQASLTPSPVAAPVPELAPTPVERATRRKRAPAKHPSTSVDDLPPEM